MSRDELRPKSSYEWCYEIVESDGDIVDCQYWATYAECRENAPSDAEIALVWRYGNDLIGEEDRAYAYCIPADNGDGLQLPECFDNDRKVPQRFHAEVAR